MTAQQTARLMFRNGRSEKFYEVSLIEVDHNQSGTIGYLVNFSYGKLGGKRREGSKTPAPVTRPNAQALFDKLVADKLDAGYVREPTQPSTASTPSTPSTPGPETPEPNNTMLNLAWLREHLHEAPTQANWDLLCHHLDRWPNDAIDVAIDYSNAHLSAWPDLMRRAPVAWWQTISSRRDEPRWQLARHLSLAAMGGGDAEAARLAETYHLARITHLDLSHNNLTADAAVALAASPFVTTLNHLNLGGNPIGDVGVEALALSPNLTRLESLDLTLTDAGDTALSALAASPHMSRLRTLRLWGNAIGDSGVQHLALSSHITALETLILSNNTIGDDGAFAIANTAAFQQLSTLDLSSNGIGINGLRAIMDSHMLPKLKTLKTLNNAPVPRP